MQPQQEPLQFLNLPIPYGRTLKPYQREDLERMLTVFGQQKATYNGNIPGAGKTCETLMWAQYEMQPNELRRFVVICPASAVGVWKAEIEEWCVYGACIQTIVSSKKTKEEIFRVSHDKSIPLQFYLCSFDLAYRPKVLSYLIHIMSMTARPTDLIVDEAHQLGSLTSKRSRAVLGNLYPLARRAMFCSGSISRNRIDQVYPVWHTMRPDLFPSYGKFINDYCVTKENPYSGMREVVAGKSKEVVGKLGALAKKNFLIRQPKEVVEAELPDIIEHKVFLDCPGMDLKRRKEAAAEFADEIDDIGHEGESEGVAQERQDLMCHKLNPAIEWILQLRQEIGNKPIVVFAYYQQNVEAMHLHFLRETELHPVIYYGPTTPAVRARSLELFQKGEADIFVASYAAAEAISLTGAAHCVIVEMSYSRMSNEQAPKRIHRLGQKKKAHVHYLLVKHTIDEVVYNSYRRKVVEHKRMTEHD